MSCSGAGSVLRARVALAVDDDDGGGLRWPGAVSEELDVLKPGK